MLENLVNEFTALLENSIVIKKDTVKVTDPGKFRKNVYKLAVISALEKGPRQGFARYLTRLAAQDLGVYPASIHQLYMARGSGVVPPTFTVPAINLRMMAFDSASAVFRAALGMDAAAMIFEIARSEMNYCDQRPSEYTTSILAAAVAEGYKGPVFIQGDHYQVSFKKYAADSKTELEALRAVMRESIAAGYFNIDVDSSTMVDLGKKTISEQQTVNVELSAMLTAYIRTIEPAGMTVSVGGEIGEVGGHNSTEEELRAYLQGFRTELKKISPSAVGLSKISIQTGTSHGGVVLPDGTIAKVNVDFDTLKNLGRVSAKEFGLGGAVQHGASTLPEDAFGHFVQYEGLEIHLATNFMNIFYDHIPASLRDEMYAYLRETSAADRKPDMTDEQFYYKTRKNAIGPFKAKSWNLPQAVKTDLGKIWEDQFTRLFKLLGLAGTRKVVEKYITSPVVPPVLKEYLGEEVASEDVSDLAD